MHETWSFAQLVPMITVTKAGVLEAIRLSSREELEVATLAGGCFWCTEAIFRRLKGVSEVRPGYSGGHVENPSYEDVCTGSTGHAEAVQILFDPQTVSFRQLLEVFFAVHDPTTLNRQGEDVGTQYRSAIFYHTPEQERTAREVVDELSRSGRYASPIVTELVPFQAFYPAEDYHLNYFERNPSQPYCSITIGPKVAAFERQFSCLLKD